MPSKSVKKMILGFPLRVSGKGILYDGIKEMKATTEKQCLGLRRKKTMKKEQKVVEVSKTA